MNAIAATIETPFRVETLPAPHFAGRVYRIACPRLREPESMDIRACGRALAERIEAAHRGAASATTVILDVEESIVPLYVDFAIQDLLDRKVRAGVLVLCNGATSHDDDSPLPQALCVNVSAANRSGSLWHPLRQRLVPARLGIDDRH